MNKSSLKIKPDFHVLKSPPYVVLVKKSEETFVVFKKVFDFVQKPKMSLVFSSPGISDKTVDANSIKCSNRLAKDPPDD